MNIFSVLDDSDNEEPVKLTVTKEVKKASSTAKETVNPSNKDSVSTTKAKNDASSIQKPKDDNVRKQKENNRKENTPSNAREVTAPVVEGAEAELAKGDNRGGRGRGRGDGKGRGRGGRRPETEGEGEERPPRKREYDRQSGNPRSGGQNRGGRGAFGFGNEKQEAWDAEKNPASAVPEIEAVDEAAVTEPAAEEVVQVAETVPATLSFDEYLAKRNEARANSEVFGAVKTREVVLDIENLRVKDEVEEADIWAGGVKTVKKKGQQRSTSKTQILDVAIKFETTPVDDDFRGGRGGRGGRGESFGRGGARTGGRGGRGDARPSRPQTAGSSSPSINLNDSSSFPSL